MYQLKKIFLFSFLYCFSNVFQAEESEQIDDIKDYDLNKLKELFDSEEMKQILENDSLLKLLGKKPLSKNYFYSTNIGLGLHNNFSDIGHKLQNWCDSYLRFSETKKDINNAFNDILEKKNIAEGCKYKKEYSGFYEYFNFMQSTLSNSFYINHSWNFQLKKSNFFTHIGLFIEKNTSKYTYDFVIAEKKKEEEFIHGLIGILVVCLALVFNFFIIGTLTLDFINGGSLAGKQNTIFTIKIILIQLFGETK